MFPNLHYNFSSNFLSSTFSFLESIDGVVNPDFPALLYASLAHCLQADMNHFALQLFRSAIHAIDTAYRDSPQRKAAYHVRSNPVRTLHTVFGDLTFTRTLYNDKHDKHHLFCFVDHILGIPKHIQYDPCIRSLIFTYSLKFNSMEKVGMAVGELIQGFSLGLNMRKQKAISKQTVAHILHTCPSFSVSPIRCNSTPDHLYIMSDEKYKSLQYEYSDNGKPKKTMIKMAIAFEGIEHIGNRNKLINPYTITGFGNTFWQDTLDVLNERYDMDKIKQITTMGDGASWIYASASELKSDTTSTRFLLDKFHAKQAINRISTKIENRELLSYYLIHDDIKEFKYLVDLVSLNKKEDRKERIKKQWNYIHSRWKEAVAIFQADVGCPMESHIEHNLATLISSVPKAYSRKWLEKLIDFIAYDKNGYDMQEMYLKALTSKQEEGIVRFDQPMNLSIFDKKPDTYDKGNSSKAIQNLLRSISRNY